MNIRPAVIVLLGAAAFASPAIVGCAASNTPSAQRQVSTTPRTPQEDQRLAERSVPTLRKCGISVAWYCSQHADVVPQSMADIAGSPYGPSPEELRSPFGPAPDGLPDYMFRTDLTRYERDKPGSGSPVPAAKFDYPTKTLMVIDRSAVLRGSSRIPVLFADGHTEVLNHDQLAGYFFERSYANDPRWAGLEDSQYFAMGWLSEPMRVATNHSQIEGWGFEGLFQAPSKAP